MKVNLEVYNEERLPVAKKVLENLVGQAISGEKTKLKSPVELSLAIVSDKVMKDINRRFRDKDEITDVLSFPGYSATFPLSEHDLGEVIISYEQCNRQAKNNKRTKTDEFIWLFAHGLFHLLGYDDTTESQLQTMIFKQLQLLDKIYDAY